MFTSRLESVNPTVASSTSLTESNSVDTEIMMAAFDEEYPGPPAPSFVSGAPQVSQTELEVNFSKGSEYVNIGSCGHVCLVASQVRNTRNSFFRRIRLSFDGTSVVAAASVESFPHTTCGYEVASRCSMEEGKSLDSVPGAGGSINTTMRR